MPSSTRDKNATWQWQSLGELCRALRWTRSRLIHELQNGLRYRRFPEGHVIDWHDPNVRRWLNLETSEVSFYDEKDSAGAEDEDAQLFPTLRPRLGPISRYLRTTVYIEVLPPSSPTEAGAPAPATSPVPPRKVSEAELRDCILAIKDERPDDPPDEKELQKLVEDRFKVPIGRNRIRKIRSKYAREWVKPRGRPRKTAQF